MTNLKTSDTASTYAERLFNKVFRNEKNIITPDVLAYGLFGNYAYEIATGPPVIWNRLYSVTVVNTKTELPERDKSQVFHSEIEARSYAVGLA